MIFSTEGAHSQKHHLQVTRSVKAPPITGPMLENKPNKLTTIPRNRGRSSRVQTYVKIPNAPWSNPAAPKPAMALPVMKAGEVGAEAQTMDPTATDQSPTLAVETIVASSPSKMPMKAK